MVPFVGSLLYYGLMLRVPKKGIIILTSTYLGIYYACVFPEIRGPFLDTHRIRILMSSIYGSYCYNTLQEMAISMIVYCILYGIAPAPISVTLNPKGLVDRLNSSRQAYRDLSHLSSLSCLRKQSGQRVPTYISKAFPIL